MRDSNSIMQIVESDDKENSANLADIRDPRFFMDKVDDDSMEGTQGLPQAELIYAKHQVTSEPNSAQESEVISDSHPAPSPLDVSADKSNEAPRA